MKNLLSHCGLFDARIKASDKDLPVPDFFPNDFFYGYLRFEGNGKIPLGRKGKRSALLTVSV